jgi:hypothetical protein
MMMLIDHDSIEICTVLQTQYEICYIQYTVQISVGVLRFRVLRVYENINPALIESIRTKINIDQGIV